MEQTTPAIDLDTPFFVHPPALRRKLILSRLCKPSERNTLPPKSEGEIEKYRKAHHRLLNRRNQGKGRSRRSQKSKNSRTKEKSPLKKSPEQDSSEEDISEQPLFEEEISEQDSSEKEISDSSEEKSCRCCCCCESKVEWPVFQLPLVECLSAR